MRYISLFSGVECASVAWASLGWEPICFAEIDPFASAVLAYRFPKVPNVGDITKHDWSRYRGQCDLVIGGSPCQSYSAAGLRKSLDDPRGQLTFAYVEAVNAIEPAWTVWENVPSILNTRDQAFGHFLARLVGESEPLRPDDKCGKWPDAGMAVGPKRAACWTLLDSQYFGVPQRRKRLFCVAVDPRHPAFPAGRVPNPAAVLLVWAGLSGHPSPRGQAGKGHPSLFETGAGGDGGKTVNAPPADVSPAVTAKWAKGSGGPVGDECQNLVAIPILEVGKRTGEAGVKAHAGIGCGQPGDPMYTLQAGAKHGVVCGPVPEVSGTLGGGSGDRGYANSLDVCGAFIPMSAVPIDVRNVRRGDRADGRKPGGGLDAHPGDPSFTVTSGGDVQAVAFTAKDSGTDAAPVSPTLRAMGHDASHANGGGQVAVAIGYGGQTNTVPPLRASPGGTIRPEAAGQIAIVQNLPDVATVAGDVAHTLRAEGADASEDGTGRGTPVVAVALRGRGDSYAAEASEGAAFALRASQGGSDKAFIASGLMVRRLTPRECERLMGLPDDWTLIPYGKGRRQKDLAEMAAYWGVPEAVAKALAADSLRYKAIGNGMAVPVIWWLGRRIEWVMERLAAWDGRFDESEGV